MRLFKPAPLPSPNTPPSPIPDVTASLLSRTFFAWVSPLLAVGITRPLVEGDLWQLDEARRAGEMADRLEGNFYERLPPSRRPKRSFGKKDSLLEEGGVGAGGKEGEGEWDDKSVATLPVPATAATRPSEMKNNAPAEHSTPAPIKPKPKLSAKKLAKLGKPGDSGPVLGEDGFVYDQNLPYAIVKTFFRPLLSSGLCLLASSLLTTFTPTVTKKLLSFIELSYAYAQADDASRATLALPPAIGQGIGLALGIALMQEFSSIFNNQWRQQALASGMMMRTSLITVISRKTLRLSGASRVKHPNGQLITFIASDCSMLEWSCLMLSDLWVQPLQILIAMVLLIVYLGYSALVGVAILAVAGPFQTLLMKLMLVNRQAQLAHVDSRTRLLQEVLNGIRVIKLYAYEAFFTSRVSSIRADEIARLRSISLVRSTMSASLSVMPILAAVLSFITYSLSGHTLDAPTVFAALQLFNIIKQPLQLLTMILPNIADAYVAVNRISGALIAEELEEDRVVDREAEWAVRAEGDFRWESSKPEQLLGGGRTDRKKEKAEQKLAKQNKKRAHTSQEDNEQLSDSPTDAPFELRDVSLRIARGSLVCVVGKVGSGKSSLIQALIGEMKRTRGSVVFGGDTSYFAQQPWVINASLKENILFGKEWDERRFAEVIEACALKPDLEILPDGLQTEIGEKGINLSGGQKARVCLARAAYHNADVVLLDDPLSAVDAHVAKHIVDRCFVTGPLADKTRILVTHHLDVLPHADHVIVVENGRIAEQGTYAELMANDTVFSKLIEDFGSSNTEKDATEAADEEAPLEAAEFDLSEKPALLRSTTTKTTKTAVTTSAEEQSAAKPDAAKLMQAEERQTGSVSWSVWTTYGRSMGHPTLAPLMVLLFMLAQGANVGNTIFLSFWSGQSIAGWSEGQYMAVYAGLGVASGVLTFAATFMLYVLAIQASFHLFDEALHGVVRSKVEWFDTTPIGRITSRLSKDVTTLDNQLPMELNQFLTLIFSVLGTVALVFYTYPLLGVIFVPLFALYGLAATYYRASSREIKRLDSNLRSFIYSGFGEMVSGLSSVRAYGAQGQFIKRIQDAIDLENSAFYMTCTLQDWLGIRLDALGSILVLGICLVGVGLRDSIDPNKIGVVLTYSLSVTGVFSQLVSIFATVEQDMNTAERVSHYGTLPSEAALITDKDPVESWPALGAINFTDVKMAYREGLPEVLKGVSFETRPGEKVGIVGRTGAGKSSLLQALFRIVELNSGKIEIDGVDISQIGLDVLRKRLSVIPQDALLYAGTVRDNLDPTGEKSDVELNSALKRAGLIPKVDATQEVLDRFAKFKLDASVADDGSNFSAGERQLVALCRALVKNSRVTVLDEATSSVDVETDASVQKAIQAEFTHNSLLSIAHRLATIAFYDRVLVMDQGQVAEFDTPLNLFDKEESIFRGMCEKAGLGREDIVRIREGAGKSV